MDQEEKRGLVFGIQHFSIHDGNGIRSNIFLKGCPLRCQWCHNPEGLSGGLGLQYIKSKCRGCGKCGHIYRNMNQIYSQPDSVKEQCASRCPWHALELVGTWMTVDEVLEEVRQDLNFFKKSQGGITISGGEPMLQADFVLALLKEAKTMGFATAIETSGYADWEDYEKILPYVDEFLWDYKATDDRVHKKLTGVSNQKILNNLDKICHTGVCLTLRCPLIPEVNDSPEHLRGIAEMTKTYENMKGAEIMPYHKYGTAKAKRIGGPEQKEFTVPTQDTIKKWEQTIIRMGGRII